MQPNKTIFERVLTEKNLILFSLLVIIVAYIPYLVLGENISFRINDNLDSNIVWSKMVLQDGGVISSPKTFIGQIMSGLPLYSVFGSYDISLLLFNFLGPFWGYVASKCLMALIGFGGMYFLLKKYVVPDRSLAYIYVLAALSFGLLPFWGFSATVAGAPFVIYSFLNLRNKEGHIWNWLILLFYAFYSSLVLIGVFVLIAFTVILLYDAFKTKKINWLLFGGLSFLSCAYMVSHLPLFTANLIDPDFVSVRKSFQNIVIPVGKIFSTTFEHIVADDGTRWPFIVSLQRYIMLPISLLAFFFLIKNKAKNRLFYFLALYIVLSSIFIGFYNWGHLAFIHDALTRVLPINPRRIYWLTPVCWYALFAISVIIISKYWKYGKALGIVALFLQLAVVLNFQEYRLYKEDVSYKKFYAQQQFSDIKEFINKDVKSYRVVSMSLHPSISQYNGFYTLDGYSVNYPLSYKYKMKDVMGDELAKNEITHRFFDIWGGWCYLFSSEQNINDLQSYRNKYDKIQHLAFNYDALKEMGADYMISAAEIDTEKNTRLDLLKVFDNYEDSHWTIYLYRIL